MFIPWLISLGDFCDDSFFDDALLINSHCEHRELAFRFESKIDVFFVNKVIDRDIDDFLSIDNKFMKM